MTTSDDFIPKCMKRTVYLIILLYWLLGAFSTAAGIYVYFYQMQPIQELITVRFSPCFLLMLMGILLFIIGFIGYVGVLRENIFLVQVFLVIQFCLFVAYVTTSIVSLYVMIFPATVHVHGKEMIRKAMKTYQDDDQLRNYIDTIQMSMECCGLGDKGYKDWMMNPYFSCNETNRSAEKCGVPASCCRFDPLERPDTSCGYGVTNETVISKLKVSSIISTQGCQSKIEEKVQIAAELVCIFAVTITVALACGFMQTSCALKVLQRKVDEYWMEHGEQHEALENETSGF